jgi:hypothetical protein
MDLQATLTDLQATLTALVVTTQMRMGGVVTNIIVTTSHTAGLKQRRIRRMTSKLEELKAAEAAARKAADVADATDAADDPVAEFLNTKPRLVK